MYSMSNWFSPRFEQKTKKGIIKSIRKIKTTKNRQIKIVKGPGKRVGGEAPEWEPEAIGARRRRSSNNKQNAKFIKR